MGHDASIEEGTKGQYDVFADGELVYSKQQKGRFPEQSEIRESLAH